MWASLEGHTLLGSQRCCLNQVWTQKLLARTPEDPWIRNQPSHEETLKNAHVSMALCATDTAYFATPCSRVGFGARDHVGWPGTEVQVENDLSRVRQRYHYKINFTPGKQRKCFAAILGQVVATPTLRLWQT